MSKYHTPARLRHVLVNRVRQQHAKQVPDYRSLRVRRPDGWSRDGFRSFLVEGQRRGDWTWSEVRGEDIAHLVVSDVLLEQSEEVAP